MQEALHQQKFLAGPFTGLWTPAFDAAISKFKESVGFAGRPYFTELTLRRLGVPDNLFKEHPAPWINEMSRYLGMHEVRDNGVLTTWLKGGDAYLGDPAVFPWCGDAVETALKTSLGLSMWKNSMHPALQQNLFWALNWKFFGKACPYNTFGAVAVFSRKGGGHVGFVMAVDEDRQRLLIRGGNQSNTVSDAWMEMDGANTKLVATRVPSYASGRDEKPLLVLSNMDSKNNRVLTNMS